jgi:catechol 2,3-dioxygenase-like lactoylglutathione lyase family enzyme
MDWKLELVAIPVSDVDRAKAFYEKAGFTPDHDHTVSDNLRPGRRVRSLSEPGSRSRRPGQRRCSSWSPTSTPREQSSRSAAWT